MKPWLATLAALAGLLTPQAATAGPVQDYLDRLVRTEKLPGAVLLVSGPRGRELATAGVANLQTREPVTAQTRFYIASSGKLVTAVATLQLVQERRLRLSDKVYPLVRNIPGISRLRNVQAVTVEQLLNHHSGMADYFDDDFEAMALAAPERIFTADESLAHAYGMKANARPGAEYDYNNTNYVLLGRLIELTDNTPYAAAVQRRMLDPVGMSATSVGARKGTPGLAHGYATRDSGKRQDVSHTGWNAITGDGAIVTTALDYEAFIQALFRDGKLLPAATVRQMCTPPEASPDSGYGLGCSIEESHWGDAWGHNGSISGFNADTWYFPKIGVTVVFMTNGDFKSDESDVVHRAVRAYLRNKQ
jgi:D-alanyl-D-alanine carboxypeptidase